MRTGFWFTVNDVQSNDPDNPALFYESANRQVLCLLAPVLPGHCLAPVVSGATAAAIRAVVAAGETRETRNTIQVSVASARQGR